MSIINIATANIGGKEKIEIISDLQKIQYQLTKIIENTRSDLDEEVRNRKHLAVMLKWCIGLYSSQILKNEQEDKIKEIADFLSNNKKVTNKDMNRYSDELAAVGLDWIPPIPD